MRRGRRDRWSRRPRPDRSRGSRRSGALEGEGETKPSEPRTIVIADGLREDPYRVRVAAIIIGGDAALDRQPTLQRVLVDGISPDGIGHFSLRGADHADIRIERRAGLISRCRGCEIGSPGQDHRCVEPDAGRYQVDSGGVDLLPETGQWRADSTVVEQAAQLGRHPIRRIRFSGMQAHAGDDEPVGRVGLPVADRIEAQATVCRGDPPSDPSMGRGGGYGAALRIELAYRPDPDGSWHRYAPADRLRAAFDQCIDELLRCDPERQRFFDIGRNRMGPGAGDG